LAGEQEAIMRYLPGLIGLVVLVGVVGGFLAACQSISGPVPQAQNPDSASCPVPSGPIALAQPEANVTTALSKPAIDTAVNTKTEIATFALG
jgi:hypothetical protein